MTPRPALHHLSLAALLAASACSMSKSADSSGVEAGERGQAATLAQSAPQEASRPDSASDGSPAAGLGGDRGKVDQPRKIIRTGTLVLEVDDYARARAAIDALVQKSGGLIASVDVGRQEGQVASATIVLRVPEGAVDGTLAALARVGTLQRESIRAEDVSGTYYDLAARLRNAKRLEERMVELAARAGGVKDLLEVEREVGRVRESIEVMEGQMRGLDDRTSLATLQVELRTRSIYVPVEEPGLGDKVDGTFAASIRAMADAGEALLLFLVAALPWLLPVGLIAFFLGRRLRRRA